MSETTFIKILFFVLGSFSFGLIALAVKTSYKETWKPLLGLLLLKRPLFEGGLSKDHIVYRDFKNLDMANSLEDLRVRVDAIYLYIRHRSFFVKYDTNLLTAEYLQIAKLIASRQAYEKKLDENIERIKKLLDRIRAEADRQGYNRYSAQRSSPTTWRETMGLNKDVREISVVKKAYKKLAMKHHPDRGGTLEEMVKVNQAYLAAQKELDFV